MTIADGARTISLGKLNWEIIAPAIAGIFEIPEDAIADAVRLYYSLANLKCEPTGALSLGAAMMNINGIRRKENMPRRQRRER